LLEAIHQKSSKRVNVMKKTKESGQGKYSNDFLIVVNNYRNLTIQRAQGYFDKIFLFNQ
jgi:hypothetical protein